VPRAGRADERQAREFGRVEWKGRGVGHGVVVIRATGYFPDCRLRPDRTRILAVPGITLAAERFACLIGDVRAHIGVRQVGEAGGALESNIATTRFCPACPATGASARLLRFGGRRFEWTVGDLLPFLNPGGVFQIDPRLWSLWD
jgi:hypothetical protein